MSTVGEVTNLDFGTVIENKGRLNAQVQSTDYTELAHQCYLHFNFHMEELLDYFIYCLPNFEKQ